jgi:hypothetical protein
MANQNSGLYSSRAFSTVDWAELYGTRLILSLKIERRNTKKFWGIEI